MYGSVYFPNAREYSPSGDNEAYLCHDGETRKIPGLGHAPTNAYWLTNLDYVKVRNTQLVHSPRILSDKFLRTSIDSMLLENGLRSASPSERAAFVSSVFSSCMRLSSHFHGMDYPPASSLAAGLVPYTDVPTRVLSNELKEASTGAYQTYVVCEREDMSSATDISFTSVTVPRVGHSQYVLRQLPLGYFISLTDRDLPMKSKRLDWVLGQPPSICGITLSNIDPAIGPLLNWGAGAGRVVRNNNEHLNQRGYATSNEIAFLADYADIEIHSVAISEDGLSPVAQLNDGNTEAKHVSYSYGIFCENRWVSFVIDAEGRPVRSPLSCWIHAEDRIACLKYAIALKKKGYSVNGYGYGRITLALSRAREEQLFWDAASLGLLAPVGTNTRKLKLPSRTLSGWEANVFIRANASISQIKSFDARFIQELVNVR